MVHVDREAVAAFLRVQDEMANGYAVGAFNPILDAYEKLRELVRPSLVALSSDERRIVAGFCRVQDDCLRMHDDDTKIPESWSMAYTAVRALVSEVEIAAMPSPFFALGEEEIAAFIRDDPRGAAVRKTILEIERDYNDEDDDEP